MCLFLLVEPAAPLDFVVTGQPGLVPSDFIKINCSPQTPAQLC